MQDRDCGPLPLSVLEAPPIGWLLSVLDSAQSDSKVVPLVLGTCDTRLLAEALGWTATWPVGVDVERGYAVFGSTGTLVFAGIIGLAVLRVLSGRTR